MGFLDRMRGVKQHANDRLDPSAEAIQEVEEGSAAVIEDVQALDGAAYLDLVTYHLAVARNDYLLASTVYPGEEEARQASARLKAILDLVRRSATTCDDEEKRIVSDTARLGYEEGNYSVVLASIGASDEPFAGGADYVAATAIVRCGFLPDEADELVLKIANIGPQEILSNVALIDAASVKEELESLGLRAQVKEGRPASRGFSREAITEQVRHEVWRRDGGQCVDCGSRERLEFDHTIPLSQGGSNRDCLLDTGLMTL